MKQYAFGVDFGGTTVKMGLFQSDGTLVEKWEIPTRTEKRGENILLDIAHAIEERCKVHKIARDRVEGVGMGVPGAVLNDCYVKPCVNLNQWGDFDVSKELSALCKVPVKIVNDANAAALGEMSAGGGKGYREIF